MAQAQRAEMPSVGEGVDLLTPEEAADLFDAEARRLLGVSGEEFLRRWDAGEFRSTEDFDRYHRVNDLLMLMPSVRPATFARGVLQFDS